jgi:hypothetical protein
MIVTNLNELNAWLTLAEEHLGDPSAATCVMFVRWHETPTGSDMVADYSPQANALLLLVPGEDGAQIVPLEVSMDGPVMVDGRLDAFHIRHISGGVWALYPSLNIPGVIHAYVVLHGVPEPAPWERLIVLVEGF